MREQDFNRLTKWILNVFVKEKKCKYAHTCWHVLIYGDMPLGRKA